MKHADGYADGASDRPITMTDEKTAQSRPLRVLGVDPELGFGGGETQVLGLTIALNNGGHRAELICDPAGRLWRRARRAGIKCHALRIRNSVDIAAGVRLRSIVRSERYDIVHFHTSRAHAMAPFVRDFAGASIVTRRMDYRPNRLFAPLLFNRAVDAVAAISEGVAESLTAAGVSRSNITVIPSGVDCERFRSPTHDERARARAALDIADDDLIVSAVGALEERKGHRYLIEAIASLAKSPGVERLKCYIAGSGALRTELEGQIQQLGCAGQMKLLGRIDDSRELLWASDIFAMPSLKEGLGVAMLEAMACALPGVASNVGGLREVVDPERTGITVEDSRVNELAS
ncbi:MAG: glycosyl transferase, partial [Candidatus Binatus sp.]|nr:glycosyl transferase [Candidatus Binatus sp.]